MVIVLAGHTKPRGIVPNHAGHWHGQQKTRDAFMHAGFIDASRSLWTANLVARGGIELNSKPGSAHDIVQNTMDLAYFTG